MRRENHGWTEREIQRLLKLHAEGLNLRVIGSRLGKSATTVQVKLKAEGRAPIRTPSRWTGA